MDWNFVAFEGSGCCLWMINCLIEKKRNSLGFYSLSTQSGSDVAIRNFSESEMEMYWNVSKAEN